MTNPTSYTDEQVRLLRRIHPDGEAVVERLLIERRRLQAEVEMLRWVPMEPCPAEAPIHFNNTEAHAWAIGFIDCLMALANHRATPNETKEAKS